MESFDLQLALGGSASLCLMQCFCAFCAFWRLSRTLERNWLAAKRRRMRKRVDSNWLAECDHEPDRACVRRTKRSGWNDPLSWIFQRSGALQPLRLVLP